MVHQNVDKIWFYVMKMANLFKYYPQTLILNIN